MTRRSDKVSGRTSWDMETQWEVLKHLRHLAGPRSMQTQGSYLGSWREVLASGCPATKTYRAVGVIIGGHFHHRRN